MSYYTHRIGAMTESDAETYAEYWQTTLERYTEADTSSEGLPGWAWALIGVAIGVVVIGSGLAVFFIVRAKKKPRDDSHAPLMEVDTTDDRDVDVYTQAEAVKEELTPEQAEEATEAPAEEAEAIVEGEVPAEESVAPADAAPCRGCIGRWVRIGIIYRQSAFRERGKRFFCGYVLFVLRPSPLYPPFPSGKGGQRKPSTGKGG